MCASGCWHLWKSVVNGVRVMAVGFFSAMAIAIFWNSIQVIRVLPRLTGHRTARLMHLPSAPDHCQLCLRQGPELTRHHLIPRRLHRKKRIREQFDRQTRLGRLLWVCRPCHHMIHSLRNEQQLGLHHNTRESLLAIPELAEFARWLGDKPAGFTPKHRKTKLKQGQSERLCMAHALRRFSTSG